MSRTAIFIDYENVRIRLANLSPAVIIENVDFISKLVFELKNSNLSVSNINIYDDFTNPYYKGKGFLSTFTAMGYTPINVLKAKDSADMELCLDAFEMCLTSEIETFVIVSSDKDMFPLLKKLKLKGKKVILVGITFNASNYAIKLVNEFIPIEKVLQIPFDQNHIFKNDIINSTKRLRDLFIWTQKNDKHLESEFFKNKLQEILYETKEKTEHIYKILLEHKIFEEYSYEYGIGINSRTYTGVKFVESSLTKDILTGCVPDF